MDTLAQRPITFNHLNAGLTLTGSATTYTTAANTSTSIDGKFSTVLSSGANASPTTDAVTGAAFVAVTANKCCCLVWGVNASGAIKLAQGPIIDTYVGVTTTVGAFLNAPQFPPIPDNFCPIAYTLVRVSPTGSTFTPVTGSKNWDASGISCTTPQNVSVLPSRPQIA